MAGITMTGTSGIDVASLITQLTALRQMEVTRISARKTTVNQQLDAFTKLGTYLNEFTQKASAISSRNDFNLFKTSSTNNDAVGITTNYNAQVGRYSVIVEQLAEREKLVSSRNLVSSPDARISDIPGIEVGKFKINGVEIELSATDTINDLRNKINGARTGVTATILNTGADGGLRLVLTADETGEKGAQYEDVDGNVLQMLGFLDDSGAKNEDKENLLTRGADSVFFIDGIRMTSTGNTISNVIQGVNVQLKKVSATPVEISLERDNDAVAKKIEDVINMYNSLLKFQDEQTRFVPGEDGKPPVRGPLFGDSTVKSVTSSIRSLFSSALAFEGSVFTSLSQVGVKTDHKTGFFELDKDKLKEALDRDFNAVVDLFITQGSTNNSQIQFGRSSTDTQSGTYEVREHEGVFQIRRKGDSDNAWVTGERSGDIVSFREGPARGMMITAPVGSGVGGVDGITTINFSKGLAGAIQDRVRQLTDSQEGVIATKRESLNSRIRTIDSQIEMAQRRVDAYRDRLVREFTNMETRMMMLNSQQSAMFAQINNNWGQERR